MEPCWSSLQSGCARHGLVLEKHQERLWKAQPHFTEGLVTQNGK